MLQYLINKIREFVHYPTNQAGGTGWVDMIIDPKSKTVYLNYQTYGCSYNSPYFDSRADIYFLFLKRKGYIIQYEEVYVETKWEMKKGGAVSLF